MAINPFGIQPGTSGLPIGYPPGTIWGKVGPKHWGYITPGSPLYRTPQTASIPPTMPSLGPGPGPVMPGGNGPTFPPSATVVPPQGTNIRPMIIGAQPPGPGTPPGTEPPPVPTRGWEYVPGYGYLFTGTLPAPPEPSALAPRPPVVLPVTPPPPPPPPLPPVVPPVTAAPPTLTEPTGLPTMPLLPVPVTDGEWWHDYTVDPSLLRQFPGYKIEWEQKEVPVYDWVDMNRGIKDEYDRPLRPDWKRMQTGSSYKWHPNYVTFKEPQIEREITGIKVLPVAGVGKMVVSVDKDGNIIGTHGLIKDEPLTQIPTTPYAQNIDGFKILGFVDQNGNLMERGLTFVREDKPEKPERSVWTPIPGTVETRTIMTGGLIPGTEDVDPKTGKTLPGTGKTYQGSSPLFVRMTQQRDQFGSTRTVAYPAEAGGQWLGVNVPPGTGEITARELAQLGLEQAQSGLMTTPSPYVPQSGAAIMQRQEDIAAEEARRRGQVMEADIRQRQALWVAQPENWPYTGKVPPGLGSLLGMQSFQRKPPMLTRQQYNNLSDIVRRELFAFVKYLGVPPDEYVRQLEEKWQLIETPPAAPRVYYTPRRQR